MKLIRIFIALVLVSGAGNLFANKVENRHVSGFHAIDVAGSFDVYITQNGSEAVKVDAPADVIDNIITEVNGGVLVIKTKDHFSWHNLFGNKKMVVYVSAKALDAIQLTGSGDVYFKDGISAGNLKLAVTGSGDLQGKITAKSVESSVTGSGDVKIWGHSDNSRVSVTGSGDFSGRDLMTNNTEVHVGGSGDADVNAGGSLRASVTGSGDIHYSGNPKSVSKSKTGSGDIEGR